MLIDSGLIASIATLEGRRDMVFSRFHLYGNRVYQALAEQS
jgi:hypothetical protein